MLIHKLTVAQFLKKLLTFHTNRKFIAVLTRTFGRPLSCGLQPVHNVTFCFFRIFIITIIFQHEFRPDCAVSVSAFTSSNSLFSDRPARRLNFDDILKLCKESVVFRLMNVLEPVMSVCRPTKFLLQKFSSNVEF